MDNGASLVLLTLGSRNRSSKPTLAKTIRCTALPTTVDLQVDKQASGLQHPGGVA